MQHTVCENLIETFPQAFFPQTGAQRGIKPRLVMRDKSDNSHRIRLSTPFMRPKAGQDDVIEDTQVIGKRSTRRQKDAQSRVRRRDLIIDTVIISKSAKRLLKDIIAIFKAKNSYKMRSKRLLAHLCSDAKKPWATFCRGCRNLNYRQLSALLREFGIRSKDMRFKNRSYKGYQKEWFVDAVRRSAKASKK